MKQSTQITDNFGRVHDYLRISLTDRCNHRCFYCMPEEGMELTEKSEIMTIEEIIAISNKFVDLGIKKIRLTGGEPLIRKNVDYLLRELGKLPVTLAMTTNGVLIDRYIDTLEEIGLKSLNISLDSLDRDKNFFITKRDYFDRIMSSIDLLLKRNFKVKINIVPIKGINDIEIIDFIEWAKNKPLSIRFIEFMPFSGNKWDWDKGVSLLEILDRLNHYYGKTNIIKIKDGRNDTALNYKIRGHKSSLAIISSVTNPFCGTCNRIRLTANGKIKNCLFSNNEFDLLTPYRNGYELSEIIHTAIKTKRKARGGMDTFDKFADEALHRENRTMTAIGG